MYLPFSHTLQVELAQTEYQLPRLTRMWTHLDRVAGGGQVKGVGEKQIEIDKRLLRDKAAALRRWVMWCRVYMLCRVKGV